MTVHMRLDHVPEPPSLSSRVNEPSRRLQTPTESITPTNTAQTVSHSDPIPIHTPLLSTHVQSSSSRLNADNGDTKSQAADPCWSERASYYSPNKVMLPIRVAQAQSKADGKVEDEEGDYAIPADMEVEIFDDFSANAGI
ncbi:uncharacterized protein LY89DRAFT_667074 [Mollisia scopiformis]|uniref:Uncharacterized protein n=1 Tax=Mollisia scopiformis TaxID=149040 RepID=A0A194XG15_MOLSC|nr:uncharacterized protein LY89DRAFT_667074 [Mollisia scopiformis]KUJ19069.1 hypothetical protein LY89DRAFT_667074 [Mollisia scopiformis]